MRSRSCGFQLCRGWKHRFTHSNATWGFKPIVSFLVCISAETWYNARLYMDRVWSWFILHPRVVYGLWVRHTFDRHCPNIFHISYLEYLLCERRSQVDSMNSLYSIWAKIVPRGKLSKIRFISRRFHTALDLFPRNTRSPIEATYDKMVMDKLFLYHELTKSLFQVNVKYYSPAIF